MILLLIIERKYIKIGNFLHFFHLDWSKVIKLPSESFYLPKRITSKDVKDSLALFKVNKYFLQIKAIIFIGISSGIGAEELYQLIIEDIDLDNRVLYINHNSQIGQSTKLKKVEYPYSQRKQNKQLRDT